MFLNVTIQMVLMKLARNQTSWKANSLLSFIGVFVTSLKKKLALEDKRVFPDAYKMCI